MTAFDANLRLEAAAWAQLEPLVNVLSHGRYESMLGDGGPAVAWQKAGGGDILMWAGGKRLAVELKAEAADRHGNLFLETWSNKCFGRQKPGWMFTSVADFLFYYFLAEGRLYTVGMPKLHEWFWGDGGAAGVVYSGRFPERAQVRHAQKNVTCGHPVPVVVLAAEVGICEWVRSPEGTFTKVRDTRFDGPPRRGTAPADPRKPR